MYDFEKLVNRVIESVEQSPGGERFSIKFQDGEVKDFCVEGDCCSYSWIEHLTIPDDINGATLLSVEDVGQGEIECDPSEHECLQAYETRFRTNRGDIVLEYRNSSNGYYGGYLVMI